MCVQVFIETIASFASQKSGKHLRQFFVQLSSFTGEKEHQQFSSHREFVDLLKCFSIGKRGNKKEQRKIMRYPSPPLIVPESFEFSEQENCLHKRKKSQKKNVRGASSKARGKDRLSPKKQKTKSCSDIPVVNTGSKDIGKRLKNEAMVEVNNANISANSSSNIDDGGLNTDSARSKKARELIMVRSDTGSRSRRSRDQASSEKCKVETPDHKGHTSRQEMLIPRDVKALQSAENGKQRTPGRRRSHEISCSTGGGHQSFGHVTNGERGADNRAGAASSGVKPGGIKSSAASSKIESKEKTPNKHLLDTPGENLSVDVSSSSLANELSSTGAAQKTSQLDQPVQLICGAELQTSLAQSESLQREQVVADACILNSDEGSKGCVAPGVEGEVDLAASLDAGQAIVESQGGSVDSVAVLETVSAQEAGSESATVVGVSDCTYTPGSAGTDSEGKASKASSEESHKECSTLGVCGDDKSATDSGHSLPGVNGQADVIAMDIKEKLEESPPTSNMANDVVQIESGNIDGLDLHPCALMDEPEVKITDQTNCSVSAPAGSVPQSVPSSDASFLPCSRTLDTIDSNDEEAQDGSAAFIDPATYTVDQKCSPQYYGFQLMDDSVSNSETSPLLNCSGEHSDGSAVLNNCSDANIKMEVCGWEYGGVLTEPDSSKEGGESCRVVDEDVFMEKMIDEQSSITETWCQEECHDCPQHQPYHGAIEVEALNQENETRREEILPTELGEPVAIEGNLHCEDPEGHVQDFADDTSSIERNENSVLNESRQDYYHEDPASSKMPLVGVQKMPSPEDNLRQQDTNKCLEDSCNLSLKNRLIHLRKLVTDDSDNAPHTNTADSNQKLETQLKNIVRIWRRKVFCSKWPLAKNSSTGYPCPCLISKCQPECPGASSNEVCQASCNIRTKARCGACAEASNLSSDVDTGLARKAGPLEGSVLDRGEKEGKKDLLKVPDSFCGEAHMQDAMAHEVELHMDSEDISISNKRDGSIFVRSIPDGLGDDSYKIVVVCDGDESEDCSEQTSTSDQSIVAEVKKTSPVTAEMPCCSVENAEEASNRTSPLVKDDVTGVTNAEICDFLGISSQEGQLPGFEVAETYKKTKYVKNTGPDASFSDEKIVCTITSDKPLENRVFITCTSPKPGEAVGQSGTIPELLVRVRLANKASSSVSRTSGVIMPESHIEARTVDAERLRGCCIEEQPSSCELSPVEIDGLADSYGCTDLSSVLEPVGDLLVIIFWVCLATTVILYELAWYPLDLE